MYEKDGRYVGLEVSYGPAGHIGVVETYDSVHTLRNEGKRQSELVKAFEQQISSSLAYAPQKSQVAR